MIPKLANSSLFQNDYKKYQQRILAVTNLDLQKSLTETLVRLKEQVMYIDRDHEQIFLTGKMPGDVTERRTIVGAIKRDLDTKLKAWEDSQHFTPAPRPNEE